MIKTAVILAAGLGSRLKEFAKDKPKGFISVGDKPIVEQSILKLKSAGIKQIIIGTGHQSVYYEELAGRHGDVVCVRNDDYANTGSMFTLHNMRNIIGDDFLLLESDLIYERRALDALVGDSRKNIVLSSGPTYSSDEVYIEADQEGRLQNMSKTASGLNSVHSELVGITKLSLSAFKAMCDYAAKEFSSNLKLDYEYALVGISKNQEIYVKKIEDLVWGEVDNENHLRRIRNSVYPLIEEKEKHGQD